MLGAAGLVAGASRAGVRRGAADYIGPALITLGLLSVITFFFVARKVLEAHRDTPVRTGSEELVGAIAEARSTLDPEGQVWIEGALWRARLGNGAAAVRLGDRVRIDAVEGLTLVVHAEPPPTGQAEEGAS